jgi:hypothetical protein
MRGNIITGKIQSKTISTIRPAAIVMVIKRKLVNNQMPPDHAKRCPDSMQIKDKFGDDYFGA